MCNLCFVTFKFINLARTLPIILIFSNNLLTLFIFSIVCFFISSIAAEILNIFFLLVLLV